MSEKPDLEYWQDHLEAALSRDGLGPLAVRVYRETSSTQEIAKSFAPGPALVVADQQTGGRGRLGRAWLSAPGASVLMSYVWPSDGSTLTHDRVSMLAGLAVAKAVEPFTPGERLQLKWPNDVIAQGSKLAGILIETAGSAFVIGIGLNVLPASCSDPAVRETSTCLASIGGKTDRLVLVESLVKALDTVLRTDNAEALLQQWKNRSSLGHVQTFEHHGQRITGEVLDLDPDHGLIVRRDTGEIVTLPAATTSVVS